MEAPYQPRDAGDGRRMGCGLPARSERRHAALCVGLVRAWGGADLDRPVCLHGTRLAERPVIEQRIEPAARARFSEALDTVFTTPAVLDVWLEAERGIGRGALAGRLGQAPVVGEMVADLTVEIDALGERAGRAFAELVVMVLAVSIAARCPSALISAACRMSAISASDFFARTCSTSGIPLRTVKAGNRLASPFSASWPRVRVSLRAKSIVSTSGTW